MTPGRQLYGLGRLLHRRAPQLLSWDSDLWGIPFFRPEPAVTGHPSGCLSAPEPKLRRRRQ